MWARSWLRERQLSHLGIQGERRDLPLSKGFLWTWILVLCQFFFLSDCHFQWLSPSPLRYLGWKIGVWDGNNVENTVQVSGAEPGAGKPTLWCTEQQSNGESAPVHEAAVPSSAGNRWKEAWQNTCTHTLTLTYHRMIQPRHPKIWWTESGYKVPDGMTSRWGADKLLRPRTLGHPIHWPLRRPWPHRVTRVLLARSDFSYPLHKGIPPTL